jgi:hypothetical protein
MVYKAHLKKERLEVIVRTNNEKIEGEIQILPGTRLLDALNREDESYIALGEAKVYSITTEKLLFQSNFLALNKDQIVMIAESYTLPSQV